MILPIEAARPNFRPLHDPFGDRLKTQFNQAFQNRHSGVAFIGDTSQDQSTPAKRPAVHLAPASLDPPSLRPRKGTA